MVFKFVFLESSYTFDGNEWILMNNDLTLSEFKLQMAFSPENNPNDKNQVMFFMNLSTEPRFLFIIFISHKYERYHNFGIIQ